MAACRRSRVEANKREESSATGLIRSNALQHHIPWRINPLAQAEPETGPRHSRTDARTQDRAYIAGQGAREAQRQTDIQIDKD